MADIGKLREQVIIQTRSSGAGPVTFSNSAPIWAEVKSETISGENSSASGLRSRVQYVLRLRNRTVTPAQRIVWNGTTLQIVGVRPLDRSYIEVVCTEDA